MRVFSTYFLLMFGFLLIATGSAMAQSAAGGTANAPDITRGQLPQDKLVVPKQPNKAQVEEASLMRKICEQSMQKDYYDCECMSLKFLELRTLEGTDPQFQSDPVRLRALALKSCPNPINIAGNTYTRCLSWAPRLGLDYEEFCTCYANQYSKMFSSNPTTSLIAYEYMTKKSLTACNAGQPARDNLLRLKLIEQLKAQGTYETLFPNAQKNKVEPLNKPKQLPPTASKLTPAQTLNNQLNDTTSARRKSER